MIDIGQSSTEWRRIVRDAELGLNAKGARRRLRYQFFRIYNFLGWRWWLGRWISMFRRMRIWALNLYKTFGADCLIAASGFVQIGRVE